MDYKGAINQLKEQKTRQEGLNNLGDWVYNTCRLFGASAETAGKVTVIFISGLEAQPGNQNEVVAE